MASETEVANSALRLIGQTAITSRTDGSANANIVDDVFDDVRDALLRCNPWNFATKRSELARVSTAPSYEYDYAYALPADWIRTIRVANNDAGHGTFLYQMEIIGTAKQRCIVTSADEVYLTYVYQETDPNKWSADFRRAMELALARDLSIPIASSNTLRQQMEAEFKSTLAAARSSDAIGGFPQLRPRGSWANSRGGNRLDRFLND